MTDPMPTLLPRREFLRGATLLAAATALGLSVKADADAPLGVKAGAARAQADATTAPSLSTLAFWAGGRFVSPATLAADAALGNATALVRVGSHFVPAGATPLLRVLQAHYAVVDDNGQMADLPVYAWAAPAVGRGKDTQFRVPVAPGGGVLFSVQMSDAAATEESYFLASGSGSGSAKLKVGTYALAAGNPDWTGVRLAVSNGVASVRRATSGGLAAPGFEYLLLSVSKA